MPKAKEMTPEERAEHERRLNVARQARHRARQAANRERLEDVTGEYNDLRRELNKAIAERDELRRQLDVLNAASVTNGAFVVADNDEGLQDLADIFVRLVGMVGVRHPAALAALVAEANADVGSGGCEHNRLDGGIAALERIWEFGASEVRHFIGLATAGVTNDVAPQPPKTVTNDEKVTDEEIEQAIANLTAQTGRVPSLRAVREALNGRPVGEHRLRRAQAEAKARAEKFEQTSVTNAATPQQQAAVTNDAVPTRRYVGDDEIHAKIVELTETLGRPPGAKAVRAAIRDDGPSVEVRARLFLREIARKAQVAKERKERAASKEGVTNASTDEPRLASAPSFINKRRAGQS